MMNGVRVKSPAWMRWILVLAGSYNILWAAWAVLFPQAYFRLFGMDPLNYPQVWRCLGMIMGVYGEVYLIAARDPFQHWPIVLVGLLGKVFGPIGFAQALWAGGFPWRAGITTPTNDLIWWIPFGMILVRASFYYYTSTYFFSRPMSLSEALAANALPDGTSLMKASKEQPLLLVFSRHYG